MMTTMMALRAHKRGGPEQLVYEEAPVPAPGPAEVLIAVHAAAITFEELTWDETWAAEDGRDRTPVIPSHEVSGTVAALGEDVTGVAVGDQAFGLIGFNHDGAAAEYATMPAAEIAARPMSLSHAETATLSLSALTAWQALNDYANLEPGERVLVQGGAGGVGIYAVQLAAILGAHVTATGSSAQADFVQRLGAASFLATKDGTVTNMPSGFDVVIDTVGGPVLEASYPLLRPGGRLVTLAAPPSPERAAALGGRAMFFIVTPDTAELSSLAELADEDRLQAVVSQTFPLSEGRQAFESARHPRPPGKTVLIVRLYALRAESESAGGCPLIW
jgi:NADPH:quinone reductase-like Zn-dependent oxidoreductase